MINVPRLLKLTVALTWVALTLHHLPWYLLVAVHTVIIEARVIVAIIILRLLIIRPIILLNALLTVQIVTFFIKWHLRSISWHPLIGLTARLHFTLLALPVSSGAAVQVIILLSIEVGVALRRPLHHHQVHIVVIF